MTLQTRFILNYLHSFYLVQFSLRINLTFCCKVSKEHAHQINCIRNILLLLWILLLIDYIVFFKPCMHAVYFTICSEIAIAFLLSMEQLNLVCGCHVLLIQSLGWSMSLYALISGNVANTHTVFSTTRTPHTKDFMRNKQPLVLSSHSIIIELDTVSSCHTKIDFTLINYCNKKSSRLLLGRGRYKVKKVFFRAIRGEL